ncbi:MAG: hypothetical protein JKY65_22705 [Planctomycetes bacterium]|nr:hypothetical protein [Planctomycetota bacterium]
MGISEEGFVQDYELKVEQELWLYCRLCREVFGVCFRPPHDRVKLRCVCGKENTLSGMDVFREERLAREHADFYNRIYQAAKGALKDAGIPLPPSGKYAAVTQIHEDSQFESYFNATEDESAIADGYQETDQSGITDGAILLKLAGWEEDLDTAADDVIARHQLLGEMIEWTYCRRYRSEDALQSFLRACGEDIDIAPRIVKAVRNRMKENPSEKIRLTFASFKHLLIHLEAEGEFEKALVVAERAAAIGLKSYKPRVDELRAKLGLA